MLKNARNDRYWNLSYAGCSCHNSKQDRRKVKHSMKRREERQWHADLVPSDINWDGPFAEKHVYEDGCCVFCKIDDHDVGDCLPDRPPMAYTTSTDERKDDHAS